MSRMSKFEGSVMSRVSKGTSTPVGPRALRSSRKLFRAEEIIEKSESPKMIKLPQRVEKAHFGYMKAIKIADVYPHATFTEVSNAPSTRMKEQSLAIYSPNEEQRAQVSRLISR